MSAMSYPSASFVFQLWCSGDNLTKGLINTVPVSSASPLASWQDGFPIATFNSEEGEGVPPSGADVNGVLNQMSALLAWLNRGGQWKYNSGVTEGYPQGALLQLNDNLTTVICTTSGNTNNPNSNMTGWQLVYPFPVASAAWFSSFCAGGDLSTDFFGGDFSTYFSISDGNLVCLKSCTLKIDFHANQTTNESAGQNESIAVTLVTTGTTVGNATLSAPCHALSTVPGGDFVLTAQSSLSQVLTFGVGDTLTPSVTRSSTGGVATFTSSLTMLVI